MPERKPRVGPFLRRYSVQEERSIRERAVEYGLAAGAGLGSIIVLLGLIVLFIRYPYPTIFGLFGVWVVGYVILRAKRNRAAAQERDVQEGALVGDLLRRHRLERRSGPK